MRVSSPILLFSALLATVEPVTAKDIAFGDSLLRHLSSRNTHKVHRRPSQDRIPPRSIELGGRAPIPQDGGLLPPPDGGLEDWPGDLAFEERRFNVSATAACSNALESMQSIVNPTGMAACYNIPFFDNSTGTFVADIRLYQVSDPTDEFANIPSSEFTLEVMIPQATLSEPEHLTGDLNSDNALAMLHEFQHIGQLNQQIQLDKLTLQDLRVLLIPNITLSAPAQDTTTATTLSSDTLSYVAGLFTSSSNPSSLFTPTFPSPSEDLNIRAINITLPAATSQLPSILASATAFVLPGQTLGIFPVGLVVTGVWTALFVGTIGWATLERMRFRDHYRRRRDMAEASGR